MPRLRERVEQQQQQHHQQWVSPPDSEGWCCPCHSCVEGALSSVLAE